MEEEIIWQAKPSLFLYWPRFVFQTLLAFSWLLLPKDIIMFNFYNELYFYHIAGGITILIVIPLFIVSLKLLCTKYTLTNERVINYSGILSRNREVVELYRVKDSNVTKPLYLRIFGYSNIVIHSSDKTAPKLTLSAIKNGYNTDDLIRLRVETMRKIKGVREFD